jgi:aliphatic nitrilase
MCSENSNPLAVFALAAEGTRIHAMSWPNHWGKLSKPMRKYVEIASLNFAQVAKAYVISACSTVDDEMIEKMKLTEDEKELLKNPEITGGSMIVSPDTEIIAGPMKNEEGILYADIDLEECIVHKLHHDFSGHYNRPDIFSLYMNKANPQLYYKINGNKKTITEETNNNIKEVNINEPAAAEKCFDSIKDFS